MEFKVLSGHNFASISDYVFATYDVNKTIFYPINSSILEDNDVIYSKTDYIYELFKVIKESEAKVKIITSESDYSITESLFNARPTNVTKWFAVNVEFKHQDLIPIPLGISNNNCTKTLKFENIKNNNFQKKKLLYINHRVETRPSSREWIYNYFSNNSWCSMSKPNLSLQQFESEMNEHYFMLCPRGNGIDTHRLWECLYSGVIPIVERQITHSNLTNLPILFVDSFKQVTEKFLLENLKNDKNLEMLNVFWWKKLIKELK